MGGEGSMQAMRNILKNNKMLLRKKSYFRREKTFLNRRKEYHKASDGIVDINKASKKDLRTIRKKIIKQRRMLYLRTTFVFLIIAPLVIYGCIRFFGFDQPTVAKTKSISQQTKIDKFDYYLNDGDNYLAQGEWHNSIFQYNKALELFPSNYSAHYRLAYAYTYRCRNTKINCTIADKKVQELLKKFPNYQELLELETVLMFVDN